jgi:ABC-2 type transport system permease protein
VPQTEHAAVHPTKSRTRLHVPPSAEQVLKLTRYQWREYVSSRRFVILIGIVIAIGVILSAIVAYFRSSLSGPGGLLSDNLAFYGSYWGGGAGFVVVLAAVFFGGDAIAGEFQNKTGYFLMGLPIRRATVYIGKYIAALLASICVLLIFLVTLLLNGAYYFGVNALPWQLVPSFILALVYLMAVLGTTFMFSSLFKTSAYGFVLTAILFLFGFSLVEQLVRGLVKMEPWMIISYASGAIGDVFAPSINWGLVGTVTTTQFPPGPPVTSYTAGVAEGVVIMLAYFVLAAVAGLFLFEREEFA